MKIQDYTDQTIYVVMLHNVTQEDKAMFCDRFGQVQKLTGGSYYDYRIHYPDTLDNYLCFEDEEILAYTRETNPEYFL